VPPARLPVWYMCLLLGYPGGCYTSDHATRVGVIPPTMRGVYLRTMRSVYLRTMRSVYLRTMVGGVLPVHTTRATMVGIHPPYYAPTLPPWVYPASLRPSYRLHVTDPYIHGVEETAWAQRRENPLGGGPSPSLKSERCERGRELSAQSYSALPVDKCEKIGCTPGNLPLTLCRTVCCAEGYPPSRHPIVAVSGHHEANL